MVYPVEVKVNIKGAVADALAALDGAHGASSPLLIWFAESLNALEHGGPALSEGHVIIRFRSGEKDDLTAKLRPCAPEQLMEPWAAPWPKTESFEYRIEGDWSGDRQSLAASAVIKPPQGSLLDAVRENMDAAAALSADQREFLAACAPGVDIDGLRALGPISATKYSDVPLDDHLDVNMERWTVDDLDFLEVSIKVEPNDDESDDEFTARVKRKQKKLEKEIRDRRVAISDLQENKTQMVLTALAKTARLRLADR